MLRITLRQIESFIAVAETGNFSQASRRLGIAQPALSLAIKELEAELGLRLFDRTTRKVELTEGGQVFLASATAIIEDLQHAIGSISDLAQRRRGRIRVAAPPLLASAVLPKAIVEFRDCYPGVTIEVFDVATDQIVEAVRTGKAECGLGTFQPNEDGIERTILARDKLLLFARTHGEMDQGPVRWSELADFPLITLTRDSSIRLLVEIGFESAQIPLKPTFEVSHITTALALVEAGLGVAVLPTYALAAMRTDAVRGIALTGPEISREVSLIHASGRSLSPAVVAFLTTVRQYAQRLMPSPPV